MEGRRTSNITKSDVMCILYLIIHKLLLYDGRGICCYLTNTPYLLNMQTIYFKKTSAEIVTE